MRFYTKQHADYCGIDLHTRTIYLCILDQAGAIVLHRNMGASGGVSESDRSVPRGYCGGRGMHLHLVLAGGSMRARRSPLFAVFCREGWRSDFAACSKMQVAVMAAVYICT